MRQQNANRMLQWLANNDVRYVVCATPGRYGICFLFLLGFSMLWGTAHDRTDKSHENDLSYSNENTKVPSQSFNLQKCPDEKIVVEDNTSRMIANVIL